MLAVYNTAKGESMTNTEIYREAKNYVSELNKNIFTCDRKKTENVVTKQDLEESLCERFMLGIV